MEELLGDYGRWDGDLDLLPMALAPDTRGRVAADNERCAWRACAFYQDCYVREMREAARQARVIVVNHTLLLLDAAMGGFLLPERDLIVIDEAHHLEEEATRAFTITVTPGRVRSLLAQQRLQQNSDPAVQQRVAETSAGAWDALARVGRPDAQGRQRLTQPIEEGLRLAGALTDLATSLQSEAPADAGRERGHALREAGQAHARAGGGYAHRLRPGGEGGARLLRRAVGLAAREVRPADAERLGGAAGGHGAAARKALRPHPDHRDLGDARGGRRLLLLPLARRADSARRRRRCPTPSTIAPMRCSTSRACATSQPMARRARRTWTSWPSEMEQLIEASRGRAFLLFSSQRALQHVLKKLEDGPAGSQFTFLVQGEGLSRIELTRQFRQRERAVLFGLKSFWEGVDVVGRGALAGRDRQAAV